MAKTTKSQMELATSFKNGFCPYCGTHGASLEKNKDKRGGYHGVCQNCHATPCFSSPSVVEMIER
jgi:transcription elongation factor Elf1